MSHQNQSFYCVIAPFLLVYCKMFIAEDLILIAEMLVAEFLRILILLALHFYLYIAYSRVDINPYELHSGKI